MRQFLFLAFRNVFRNRRRTVMTMLIVAVGVAALMLSGGFFVYMFRELAEGPFGSGSGICRLSTRRRREGWNATGRSWRRRSRLGMCGARRRG